MRSNQNTPRLRRGQETQPLDVGESLQGRVILRSNLKPSEVESATLKNEVSGKIQRPTASLLSGADDQ